MNSARFAATACALSLALGASRSNASAVELTPTDSTRLWFGSAVAQDARWIFIGDAPPHFEGKLWIYEKTSTGPVFRQVIDGGTTFGCSIAVSIDEIAVGECYGTALRIFKFDGATWTQKTLISEVEGHEAIAMGIAYDGPNKLLVGELKARTLSMYTRSGTAWTRTGEVAAPTVSGTYWYDFANAVRLVGDELVVAGRTFDGLTAAVGRTQLYKRSGATWVADGAPFPKASGRPGTTMERVGTQWLIGDPYGPGAVYLFSKVAADWKLDQTLVSPDPQPYGNFGCVAASGSLVAVNDPGMREVRNLVHSTSWKQVAPRKIIPKNSNAVAGAVSLFGSTLVVGATTQIGAGSAFVVDLACAKDADCGAGTFCDTSGLCGAQGSPGASCDRDAMCASGFCTDGVCCESRCQRVCEACDVSGSAGTCLAVIGAPHQTTTTKRPPCPGDAADACSQRACDGVARTSCAAFAGSSVVCRQGSCSGTRLTAEARCDGSGVCPAAVSTNCNGFACEATMNACRASCANRFDCEDGYACKDATCVKLAGTCGPDGASVVASDGTNSSCNGFVCVDGACLTKCTQSLDCAAGKACDVGAGNCVDASAAPDDGGGCIMGRATEATGAWALVLVGLGMVARRMRKANGQ